MKLPFLEKKDWVEQLEMINCLNEGLELLINNGQSLSFVFYKDYSDGNISISGESVIDINEKVKKKEIISLRYNKEKKSNNLD